ncbi:MAG: cupin-like domain-containing protein [Pseudomonadota bacterium]
MNQSNIAAPAPGITNDWRRWIAENLILDSHPSGLFQVLVQNGIEQGEARYEIEAALQSPYIAGAQRLKNRLRKHDWVLDIQRKLNRLRPTEIVRRHQLSREDFLRDHYSVNQPVIITGMMDNWPAMKKWNLDFFREQFGEREVEVQFGRNADANYEMNSVAHRRQMKFGEYVDLVRSAGHTNDFYMTANNDSLNRTALTELWADIEQVPEYLSQQENSRGFFWFGPAGTITPFHHDLTNNFMAQVMGRKRLRIMPACEVANTYNNRHCFTPVDGRDIDIAKFPAMANAQVLECVLEPGEILFLPVGCWHFVEGLDISVTIAFTNFLWDNDFYSNYPENREF